MLVKENNLNVDNKTDSRLPRLNIPKQNFSGNSSLRPFLDSNIVKELKEVFELFAENHKVNPHNIKNGLRSIDFHKGNQKIYKIIEDLCLQYDINETPITFDQFINFLNERLGDSSSRLGINDVFSNLMDPKVKEITPKQLHLIVKELGHDLSLEDVKYLLERVSEPSLDINITSDEFYYIMTKKPAEVDLITPVTKSTK